MIEAIQLDWNSVMISIAEECEEKEDMNVYMSGDEQAMCEGLMKLKHKHNVTVIENAGILLVIVLVVLGMVLRPR